MAFPTVFSQVIQLIPRTEFEAIVARHNGDARCKISPQRSHSISNVRDHAISRKRSHSISSEWSHLTSQCA